MIYVQAAILGPLQKVISHKYANDVISYMMIYVQAAILRQLQKKKEKEERLYWGHYGKKTKKKKKWRFHLNPQEGHLSQAPLLPLYNAPGQVHLQRMSRYEGT